MQITRQQLEVAVAAGLTLTNPESETLVPIKFTKGVEILHQILIGIGSGQLLLRAVEQPATATPPKPPVGKRKTRKKRPGKKEK